MILLKGIIIFLDEEEDKQTRKENNDGIYNYDEPSNKQEPEIYYTAGGGYKDNLSSTPRRRLQNPQHIKLMVCSG